MSETELEDREPEEKKKKKRGILRSIGDVLANPEFLMAIGGGLQAGPNRFAQGASYGLRDAAYLQDRRLRGEQEARKRELIAKLANSADPRMKAIAEAYPDVFVDYQLKSMMPQKPLKPEDATFQYLVNEVGMSPDMALRELAQLRGKSEMDKLAEALGYGFAGPSKAAAGAAAETIKTVGTSAQAAQNQLLLFDEAKDLMDDLRTGVLAPARQAGQQYLSELGFKGAEEQAAKWDRLQSIEKELGIQQLQFLGGNDTERELLTAIETNVGRTKQPSANLRIVRAKSIAAEVAIKKEQAINAWTARYGDPNRPDPQGRVFAQVWEQELNERIMPELKEKYPQIESVAKEEGSEIDALVEQYRTPP